MARDVIEVDASGFRDIVEGINALERTVLSKSARNQTVREVGAILLARIRRRFLEETDPDGKKWPQSKAAQIRRGGGKTYRYVNGTRKGYSGTGTLFETGALFQSIQLGRAVDGEINIGTDIPYAPFLQRGTQRLPARVFLGFGEDDQRFTEQFIQKKIEDALREAQKQGGG